MISEKIIKFVEGELSIMEIEELEQEFLNNPELLEVAGGLMRIKKDLPPTKKLYQHLEQKKKQIRQKICTTQQEEENIIQDNVHERIEELITQIKPVSLKNTPTEISTHQDADDRQQVEELLQTMQ